MTSSGALVISFQEHDGQETVKSFLEMKETCVQDSAISVGQEQMAYAALEMETYAVELMELFCIASS